MDGLSKKLTEKDVTEALSQRKELLECYRQRLAMLSKEYEDSGELIEMLQMRSSRNDFGNNKGGFAHGLYDIYLLYEKQKKKLGSGKRAIYRPDPSKVPNAIFWLKDYPQRLKEEKMDD